MLSQCKTLMKNWGGAISQVNSEIQGVNSKITEVESKGVKIATGFYTGTGKFGENNAKSLTFDFVPKLVKLVSYINPQVSYRGPLQINTTRGTCNEILTEYLTTTYKVYSGFSESASDYTYGKISEDGKTLFWYDKEDDGRMYNGSGWKYYYIAIG